MRIDVKMDFPKANRLVRNMAEAGLTEAARVYGSTIQTKFGNDHGGVPSAPGGYPNTQSGRLYNNIFYVSPASMGTPMQAHVGTWLPYGHILHTGGTIKAKNGKYLAIPINARAKQMSKSGLSLRNYKMVYRRKKDGRKFMFEDKKGGGVFRLKESVYIKKRPWITLPGAVPVAAMQAAFIQGARRAGGVA
jgi:hypothetical protein